MYRWGDEGYFKILRGDDSCECNICNLCTAGIFYGNHSDLSRTKPIPDTPGLFARKP
jgi:hypothetical protein